MRIYEVMVIFDPDTEERTVQPTLDRHLKVITKGGGTVDNVDIWGRRRLAYEIRKKSEGIYAVINLTAEPSDVKELDRQFTINESIMRTKVIRPDLHLDLGRDYPQIPREPARTSVLAGRLTTSPDEPDIRSASAITENHIAHHRGEFHGRRNHHHIGRQPHR